MYVCEKTGLLCYVASYLFEVCIRKIHLWAFLIYRSQADRVENNNPMATNHGYSLMIDCCLNPNPKLSSGPCPCTEITVESDVMLHLNPSFIHHQPNRKERTIIVQLPAWPRGKYVLLRLLCFTIYHTRMR